jgi:hypothetical protein
LMLSQQAADMDGVTPTDAQLADMGLSRAFYETVSDPVIQSRVLDRAEPGYRLMLRGSAHNTFASDVTLFAPLLPDLISPEEVGSIDGRRAVEIVNAYIVAFFDRHVKGQDAPLLDAPSNLYAEAQLEIQP